MQPVAPHVPLLGRGECCARLGPGWEQPVHGPSIAQCRFVPEMLLAEQRGCSEVCVLTFSSGEEWGFFWGLSPELSHCHFSVPAGCVQCCAASAESEGQAGGGQASPVGYVGQCGAVRGCAMYPRSSDQLVSLPVCRYRRDADAALPAALSQETWGDPHLTSALRSGTG